MGILFGDSPFPGRTPGTGERELDGGGLAARFFVPDKESKKRLKRYEEADKLLELEEHVRAFERQKGAAGNQDTQKHWIPLDLPGMLGRLMRHYVLGEDFSVEAKPRGALPSGEALVRIKAEAQAEVDRISRNSEVECLLRQVLEVLPTMGDAVVRVDVQDMEPEEGGQPLPQAVMRYVDPRHYFPMVSPVDQTKVEEVTLAWVFPMENDEGSPRQEQMVLREVHTPGQVDYKLNRWDGELGQELTVTEHFPGLEDFATGIDEIPVVHLGWQTRAGQHFGESELLRVAPIILALENRLAQVDEVLEKHARPKLVVGPGILDDNGKARLKDFDVIEVSPDIFEKAVKPEYLTWNAQLDGVQSEIEKLEEYFFMTTETSPASFGLERDGSQVESARALRFKAHRTVNKAEDARKELAKDIRLMYGIAQKLELAERSPGQGYRRSGVLPVFGDPILEDQTQEVLDYVSRKGVGLASRVRAVMDLDNLTRAEAEVVVQEILQDEVDEAAAASATLGGPDDVLGAGEAAPAAGEPALGTEEAVLGVSALGPIRETVAAVQRGDVPWKAALGMLQVTLGLSAAEARQVLGPEPEDEDDDPEGELEPEE